MTDTELIRKIATKFASFTKLADFRESTVMARFKHAGGRCECKKDNCWHVGPCPQEFEWKDRGTADNYEAWQAHHWIAVSEGGSDHVTNCRILCVRCHKNTESYGKSKT